MHDIVFLTIWSKLSDGPEGDSCCDTSRPMAPLAPRPPEEKSGEDGLLAPPVGVAEVDAMRRDEDTAAAAAPPVPTCLVSCSSFDKRLARSDDCGACCCCCCMGVPFRIAELDVEFTLPPPSDCCDETTLFNPFMARSLAASSLDAEVGPRDVALIAAVAGGGGGATGEAEDAVESGGGGMAPAIDERRSTPSPLGGGGDAT